MSAIVSRRRFDGVDKVVLRFPSGSLKGLGSSLAAAMGEEGLLLGRGSGGEYSRSSWRFERILEEGGEGLLVGPHVPGFEPESGEPRSLDEAGLDEAAPLEERLSLLLALSRAFAFLSSEKALPRGIVSSGILVSASGDELLVLPPKAAARALSAAGPEARGAAIARLSSPRADSAEADASFFLGQAAYRLATGASPYGEAAAEAGSVAPARASALATVLAAPRLDLGLASLVDRALAEPGSASLADWVAALEKAEAARYLRELSAAELAELERRRTAAEAAAAAKRKRADFWRRRGGIVAAVAVAVVVLGLIAGDMLRAQKDKPSYASLGPAELAARYYKAIEDMDIDSLEACGEKKACESDWNYVMNVTVITKTRLAYEGKSPVVHAQAWVDGGGKPLGQGDFLYGIAGLSLVREPGGTPDSVAYRASYSFWSLDHKEDPAGDPNKTISAPLEERRVDRLTLRTSEKWKGWKIVKLERAMQP